MRLENIGLREFVEDRWKMGLETERGVEVLEPRFYYIQHEPLILRRRGFMMIVKDYRGYYGIAFIRPKNGLENGYWDVAPDGEWDPNPNVEWEAEVPSAEKLEEMHITEPIYYFGGGWFVSTQVQGKFDYHFNFLSEGHKFPDQPESEIPLL